MHPRILAQRTGTAQDRMRAAAATLAEQHGLPAELAANLAAYDRDPETRGVMRQEAVADLLEALVDRADPATGEDLEAMSVADLKDLADKRGVELKAGMKKAEIIAALEDAPEPLPVSSHPAGDALPASSQEVK